MRHVAEGPHPESVVVLDVPPAIREGTAIAVRVHLPADQAASSRGGEVTLTRRVAYRYREESDDGATHLATARRTEVVARADFPGPAPAAGDVEALLPVPAEGPPSADSELVSVDWFVRARWDLGEHGVAQDVRKVMVVAAPSAPQPATAEPQHGDPRGHAVVSIEGCPDRSVAPGDRLTGDVVVVPLHPGRIRSVRVELVLREFVPHPPTAERGAVGGKSCSTVIAASELARGVEAREAWRTLRMPFALQVPAGVRAPSVTTPEFELAWVLRAVVSRPLHRDAYAEIAVQVAAAEPLGEPRAG